MSNQQKETERTRSSGIDAVLRKPIDAGLIPGVVALAANQDGIFYQGAFGRRAVDKPAAIEPETGHQVLSFCRPAHSRAVIDEKISWVAVSRSTTSHDRQPPP